MNVGVVATVALAGAAYAAGVRRFDASHPRERFARVRAWSFAAGLAVVLVALVGPLDDAAARRFSAHMGQHLLLTLVAPPMLLWGRPLMLARRATPPRVRRAVASTLRTGAARTLAHPVVAWSALALAMWASHFTSLYEAALRSDAVHAAEHALYLGAGVLFWLPVVAVEPSPWRLDHAARVLYIFLALPANALLAVALYESRTVLYASYAGTGALEDQRVAAVVMWVAGGLLLVAAVLLVTVRWARAERYSRASPSRPSAKATAPTTSSHGA
ncbi:MAG TPA: cytochrome c oxidase assembly protein [Actinomycetota bacterium]|nr:cytochrome c oxidase assembly protein [Actinomycetota bacterium]